MEPSLQPGDWLLVWRGLWPARPPRVRPGQIVVAQHPARPGFLLVKRAVRRADGGWWLESDNQTASAVDSRSFGAVRGGLICGRVLLRYRHGQAAAAPGGQAPGGQAPGGQAPGGQAPGDQAPAAGARMAEDPHPQERDGGPRTDG
jgi:nickel-type superoxide dismutase maturation protease